MAAGQHCSRCVLAGSQQVPFPSAPPRRALARLVRAGASWSAHAAGTAINNLAEYLAHESADLVSRNEGEQFLRGVDALREDVDRAQARLERLAGRTRT